ncbi:ferritin-like domain-containing protein [Mesoplasma lactucae]|uniref:Uncharacterized protein n=1 Tax=Mesoplasma lactucae ATCC 49193 TaxID=81460 RepID=A0A291IRW9_9MOLU|nr:ferritin-like domain-containing protein [Mesoplasma lactucae]ATG97431.1 hypothetical protein CP520_01490 [Mesoplasma lactucae ATCC 49193]ATZ20116.1 ferritin [Mesoplasma lactucae ATCC 49193]MCL8216864.1 hypothetical protein [Mesoplasma lactucae ATCC 49193]
MINKDVKQDVVDFLNLHIQTQLECMWLSQQLSLNGFPGFSWFYQVQSEDEFMHQRRIINYLQGTTGAEDYEIKSPDFKTFTIQNPKDAVTFYINMRQKTLDFALKIKQNAIAKNDYLTAEFYSWFIKDYWTEIDENKDILDRIEMNGTTLAGLDRRMGKREEINPEDVIHPMAGFKAD